VKGFVWIAKTRGGNSTRACPRARYWIQCAVGRFIVQCRVILRTIKELKRRRVIFVTGRRKSRSIASTRSTMNWTANVDAKSANLHPALSRHLELSTSVIDGRTPGGAFCSGCGLPKIKFPAAAIIRISNDVARLARVHFKASAQTLIQLLNRIPYFSTLNLLTPHCSIMVLPKSKNAVGLGNALMNDRLGKGKGADRKKTSATAGVARTDANGDTYFTNKPKEAAWVKMRSVTEQAALDEFLSTAELAGTDFTAEKTSNVKIIHTDQNNPYLLSAREERSAMRKHAKNKGRLTVPRRPKWDESTTPQQLDVQERQSLLEWRRGLAELQENDDLLMTPFERNIEVWRQLWRVIERSDLVVQIVDARNPLLFRCEDLEKYVKEVDHKKRNLLLINKSDMLTDDMREQWAAYFEEKGINYKFFSAYLANEQNEARQELESPFKNQVDHAGGTNQPPKAMAERLQKTNLEEEQDNEEDEEFSEADETSSEKGSSTSSQNDRTRILTVDELESLFLENSPMEDPNTIRRTTIGLVGYPNVGKSSTINALIGAKKVSVSSTPGKTKHFQTIHLSDSVVLCDCPGLVFPNFATTKADLVCNGILPIDSLRESMGPVGLVTKRIPQSFLEAVYGIKINIRPLEEGGTGVPTASELLRAYAKARGFATTGQGQPDESRAARYVLKDYVNGKLLFCQPPPHDPEIDPAEFNRNLYDFAHLPSRRQRWLQEHNEGISVPVTPLPDGDKDSLASFSVAEPAPQERGARSKQLDRKFFGPGSGNAGHLRMPFNHQYTEQGGKQKQLSGRKERTMVALEKDVDPAGLRAGGKKHFKPSRQKQRNKTDKMDDDDI
jgi:large subunit GTPase 1